MAEGVNHYRVDMRELRFVLTEQFNTLELLGRGRFAEWGEEELQQVLASAERYAKEVAGPLNALGDRVGCQLVDGRVVTPPGFKAGFQQLYENGFKSLVVDPEYGGAHSPKALSLLVNEVTAGSNTALDMYGGLTVGAADLIAEFGTDDQKARYCEAMFSGRWAGTMCLTEPQAGSDVGASVTSAKPQPDGSYRISGTKIFISGGDQDLTDNIIHLVLARVEGAAAGTQGLSLFIVPKLLPAGGTNDVRVNSIEHKMGINGSSTCVLNFGDQGECYGELCGGALGQGMRQMFKMMNFARIGVAVQSLGNASNAYLNALNYARDRKQGASIELARDPEAPRVPILAHPDVRRQLLEMKAKVEGIRALIVKAGNHADQAAVESEAQRVAYHLGQIDILTPLVKAYASDQAFEIGSMAISIHGGAGYTQDYSVEQACRDSKIFAIYEGTNHIQALDLVFRKLTLEQGALARALFGDIKAFVEANKQHQVLGAQVAALGSTLGAVSGLTGQLAKLGAKGLGRVALVASPFLKLLSELCVGWMLLDAAVVASAKSPGVPAGHPDADFYRGKLASASYFASAVLPRAAFEATQLAGLSLEPLEIPDGAFATV